MFLCFLRSVLFRQSQQLEPLLGHPQPRLLLGRIRHLFCAFPRIFEVSSVSRSIDSHGFTESPNTRFGSSVLRRSYFRDLGEGNFLTREGRP
jgi:hypothetical protein